MRLRDWVCSAMVLLAVVVLSGCGGPYRIIRNLEEPLQMRASCTIGSIVDALPTEFDQARKPSKEDIEKFKICLKEEISKMRCLTILGAADSTTQYELRGSILEYSSGGDAGSILFGPGTGRARVIANLELVHKADDRIVFSGSFKGKVSHYAESGDEMFRQVARSFAKALDKQVSKMIREK
jgi:hypothetical protein